MKLVNVIWRQIASIINDAYGTLSTILNELAWKFRKWSKESLSRDEPQRHTSCELLSPVYLKIFIVYFLYAGD